MKGFKVCFEKFADISPISEMLHPSPSTKLIFQSIIQYVHDDLYFKFTC